MEYQFLCCLGDNSILQKAIEAKENTYEAQEIEGIELAVLSANIGKDGYQELNQINLQNAIDTQFETGKAIVTDNGDGTFIVSLLGSSKIYKVEGTVEQIQVDLYISNKDELKAFRDRVNNGETFKGKYIKLTNNIQLDLNEEWIPIGKLQDYNLRPYDNINTGFCGIFDGNGYEINGIKINTNNKVQGLFGLVRENGQVINLGMGTNNNITGGAATGAIVGYLYDSCTVNNCYNKSIVNSTYGGGIVGCSYKNCQIEGVLK